MRREEFLYIFSEIVKLFSYYKNISLEIFEILKVKILYNLVIRFYLKVFNLIFYRNVCICE